MIMTLAQDAAASDGGGAYILWGFGLLAVAVGMLLLEFIVPSGGLIGVLCGVAAVGSVIAFWRYDQTWGITAGVFYVVATPFLLIFFFKLWISSPLAKKMILTNTDETFDAATSADEVAAGAETARRQRLAELRALIGASGVTVTWLRPVGTVKINGQRVDAMAESGVIGPNTPIVVTDVYDNQIKVRPA